jgi:acyl carrier protein
MSEESAPLPRLRPPVSSAQLRLVIANIETRINLKNLEDDTPLKDAGADSLDFFNFILAVEDVCSIVIPSEDIYRVNTLGGMARYLNGRLS